MVNELVEAKIKHIMDPDASDDSDFEDCGDNINKAIQLLSRKLKVTKRILQGFRIDFNGWKTNVIEIKRTVRQHEKKFDKIDEQEEELDLSDLNEKQTLSVGDIVRAMATLQQSVLAKTVSNSDMDLVKQQLIDAQGFVDELKAQREKEQEFRDEVEELLELKSQMKDLEIHYKKIEASNSSIKATVFQNAAKLQTFSEALTKDEGGIKELKLAAADGKLNASMIIDEMIRISSETKVACVRKEQFEQVQSQATKLESMVNDLKAFRVETAQKQTDHQFDLVKHEHTLQDLKHAQEHTQQQVDIQDKQFTKKLETDIIKEELQSLMMNGIGGVRDSTDLNSADNKIRAVNPVQGGKMNSKGAGMSITERTQLKNLVEDVERIGRTQKRIDQQLQLIRPEEFRKRLHDAETTVEKIYRKEQTDELLNGINSAHQYLEGKVSKFYAEFENTNEKIESKIDAFDGKHRNLQNQISTN